MANKKKYHYVLVITNNGPVFVTKEEGKYAGWDKNAKPLELGDHYAETMALGLCMNGHVAFHVVMRYELMDHVVNYAHGSFKWQSNNEQKESA